MDSINFKVVGDMMFGDSHINIGTGVRSKCRRFGYGFPFLKIKEHLKDEDSLLIGNLECALSMEKAKFRAKPFIGDMDVVDGLGEAGFDALNMANNHIYEYGDDPAIQTYQRIINRGIIPFGLPKPALTVASLHFRGVSIGLVGCSMIPTLKNDRFERNTRKILEEIKTLASHFDILIVSIHWGAEFVEFPSSQQIEFGHLLTDSGARIVLGHHPHVLQPIEQYKNGLIAYSLGNFIFDTHWLPETLDSALLRVTVPIKKNIEPEAQVLLLRINRNYQPETKGEVFLQIEEFNRSLGSCSISILEQPLSDKDYLSIAQKRRDLASKKMKSYILKRPYMLSLYSYQYLLRSKIYKKVKKHGLTDDLVNASWLLSNDLPL